MSKNLLPRICKACGVSFIGGPRAWYCPQCREERKREASKRFKRRKGTNEYIPIGSIIQCEICGKDIIKNSSRQRYCKECAKAHLKEVDNKQSLDWKCKHPEKIKEGKRRLSKQRHQSEGRRSGIKYISWDKGSLKWRVTLYLEGKQYHIGRFWDLSDAEKELNKFMSNRLLIEEKENENKKF